MLKWLRDLLRTWLAEEKPIPRTIECLIDGEIERAAVVGTIGTCLQITNGQGRYLLIYAEQCVDQEEFWRIWQHHNPGGMQWEDGESYEPTKP